MAERGGRVALMRGDLAFTLIRSDRRTLAIIVDAEGAVFVRAPKRAPERCVLAFVEDRRAWIADARVRVAARPPRTPPPTFADGETHLHLGRAYRLTAETGLRAGVQIDDEQLVLILHRPAQMAGRAALLARWRLMEARRVYAERLAALFPPFAARGFTLPAITVRVLKRRWGSLSRDGRMTLSRDLIRAPIDALDFVIAHELCHLVHFDHGPGFKALMAQTMPDYPQRRVMLEHALW